ncbi:C40 family peptidase [Mesosutterella sp. AGMB02718]|uniref:C40 family peptidase n=1 Tax=Mesosutterella faecium TaxID=2925194 RepID=A0ABT7IN92_9BURK|nr:C40 family peptidase [Mesosutterella sp. AGMB02718]MDL2059840.1 C40 family peptidase [Mesosutterella sp. AGMB02718]
MSSRIPFVLPAFRRALIRAALLFAAGTAACCPAAFADPAEPDPLASVFSDGADSLAGLPQDSPLELGPSGTERHRFGLRLADSARSQIGTPYRVGRSKPGEGFDCSGLVWWVYRQYGIELPRVSTLQAKVGDEVDLSQAHPGDIVVFKTGRGPNGFHSGIITSPGHFIHAPRSGKLVQETEIKGYWSNRLYTVRHVRGLKLRENLLNADEISRTLESMSEEEKATYGIASSDGFDQADPLYSVVQDSEAAPLRLNAMEPEQTGRRRVTLGSARALPAASGKKTKSHETASARRAHGKAKAKAAAAAKASPRVKTASARSRSAKSARSSARKPAAKQTAGRSGSKKHRAA